MPLSHRSPRHGRKPRLSFPEKPTIRRRSSTRGRQDSIQGYEDLADIDISLVRLALDKLELANWPRTPADVRSFIESGAFDAVEQGECQTPLSPSFKTKHGVRRFRDVTRSHGKTHMAEVRRIIDEELGIKKPSPNTIASVANLLAARQGKLRTFTPMTATFNQNINNFNFAKGRNENTSGNHFTPPASVPKTPNSQYSTSTLSHGSNSPYFDRARPAPYKIPGTTPAHATEAAESGTDESRGTFSESAGDQTNCFRETSESVSPRSTSDFMTPDSTKDAYNSASATSVAPSFPDSPLFTISGTNGANRNDTYFRSSNPTHNHAYTFSPTNPRYQPRSMPKAHFGEPSILNIAQAKSYGTQSWETLPQVQRNRAAQNYWAQQAAQAQRTPAVFPNFPGKNSPFSGWTTPQSGKLPQSNVKHVHFADSSTTSPPPSNPFWRKASPEELKQASIKKAEREARQQETEKLMKEQEELNQGGGRRTSFAPEDIQMEGDPRYEHLDPRRTHAADDSTKAEQPLNTRKKAESEDVKIEWHDRWGQIEKGLDLSSPLFRHHARKITPRRFGAYILSGGLASSDQPRGKKARIRNAGNRPDEAYLNDDAFVCNNDLVKMARYMPNYMIRLSTIGNHINMTKCCYTTGKELFGEYWDEGKFAYVTAAGLHSALTWLREISNSEGPWDPEYFKYAIAARLGEPSKEWWSAAIREAADAGHESTRIVPYPEDLVPVLRDESGASDLIDSAYFAQLADLETECPFNSSIKGSDGAGVCPESTWLTSNREEWTASSRPAYTRNWPKNWFEEARYDASNPEVEEEVPHDAPIPKAEEKTRHDAPIPKVAKKARHRHATVEDAEDEEL